MDNIKNIFTIKDIEYLIGIKVYAISIGKKGI